MKIIVPVIMALLSLPVLSQPSRPYEFEVVPGCIMKKDVGRCVVQNKLGAPIECMITIDGRTLRGFQLGSTRTVVIQAGYYDDSARVYAAKNDVLVHVSATADCRAE
jgi:hypothetical protein